MKLKALIKHKKSKPLSNKQYVYARYAGFSKEELSNKDRNWIKENNDVIFIKGLSSPCTLKQVEFLARSNPPVEASIEEDSYIDAKSIIVDIILASNDDERFNVEHQKIVDHNTTNRRKREEVAHQSPIDVEMTERLFKLVTANATPTGNKYHIKITDPELESWLKLLQRQTGEPMETIIETLMLAFVESKQTLKL